MEYKATKVSDEILPTGVSQLYQGHIVKSDAVSTAELAERAASRMKIDVDMIKNAVTAFGKEIVNSVKAGERPVFDGVFTSRLTCQGSFDYEDASWDETRNSVSLAIAVSDAISEAVKAIVPKNVLSKANVQLLGSQDATTSEQDTLTVGHALQCQGKNIQVTAANDDEGYFLRRESALTTEYKATVTSCTAGTADMTFPANMPAGDDYTLIMRGRAGCGKNRSLVESKITGFTVKA